ncbi:MULTISPECIES: Uma2 family endonuclease [unclassified Okeania]|uniref:Uma2 family endonuclease n=1 Tax=unclassified Okeania TaxID=2634635 RepID=UPI00257EE9E2|nr:MULTISPECIES: Uma2 family endonuclease [unclassified Okeania]
MVVFSRPQEDRSSYKQWEEDNISPQVVFEIVSPRNSITELEVAKLEFYSEYKAQQYYVYDPDTGRLKGWLCRGEVLTPIEVMEGWISPRIGIRFEKEGRELQIYPPDGERFATYVEILEQKEQARQNAERERQIDIGVKKI